MKEYKSFIYDISPEEEETLEKNTLQKIARKKEKKKVLQKIKKKLLSTH